MIRRGFNGSSSQNMFRDVSAWHGVSAGKRTSSGPVKGGDGGSPGLTLEPWLPKGGRGDSAINSLQGSSAASPVHTKVMLVMSNENSEIYNDDLKSHISHD